MSYRTLGKADHVSGKTWVWIAALALDRCVTLGNRCVTFSNRCVTLGNRFDLSVSQTLPCGLPTSRVQEVKIRSCKWKVRNGCPAHSCYYHFESFVTCLLFTCKAWVITVRKSGIIQKFLYFRDLKYFSFLTQSVLNPCFENTEGLGPIPGQGARSYTPQLKILHVAAKNPLTMKAEDPKCSNPGWVQPKKPDNSSPFTSHLPAPHTSLHLTGASFIHFCKQSWILFQSKALLLRYLYTS